VDQAQRGWIDAAIGVAGGPLPHWTLPSRDAIMRLRSITPMVGGRTMAFLDKIREFLGGGGGPKSASSGDPYGINLYLRCKKCGELFRVRVDRRSDLSRTDDGPGAFYLRKEVMDDKCFQLSEVEMWFDSSYRIVESDVRGAELISQEEYEAAHPTE
jgi:hypothetical protein